MSQPKKRKVEEPTWDQLVALNTKLSMELMFAEASSGVAQVLIESQSDEITNLTVTGALYTMQAYIDLETREVIQLVIDFDGFGADLLGDEETYQDRLLELLELLELL